VSLIHSYTAHGDPFVRRFTDSLLEEVSRPFFHSLGKWMYEGELLDPFDEFFVELNPEMRDVEFGRRRALGSGGSGLGSDFAIGALEGDGGAQNVDDHRLWETKYAFRREMLPSFVNVDFGRKVRNVADANRVTMLASGELTVVLLLQIFSTGKSLNFIKYSCNDTDWVVTRNRLSHSGRGPFRFLQNGCLFQPVVSRLMPSISIVTELKYSDITGLERSIDAAYSIASQRLFDIFFDKFRLLDHLRALKDYLMLGRGDFVELLMESLGSASCLMPFPPPPSSRSDHMLKTEMMTDLAYQSPLTPSTAITSPPLSSLPSVARHPLPTIPTRSGGSMHACSNSRVERLAGTCSHSNTRSTHPSIQSLTHRL
jgi:gamma-tubulin complex component 3